MTTDQQRWDAIGFAEKLLEMISGQKNEFYSSGKMRIPKELRDMARILLKHYPNDLWVERMQEQAESAIERGLDEALAPRPE